MAAASETSRLSVYIPYESTTSTLDLDEPLITGAAVLAETTTSTTLPEAGLTYISSSTTLPEAKIKYVLEPTTTTVVSGQIKKQPYSQPPTDQYQPVPGIKETRQQETSFWDLIVSLFNNLL